MAEIPGSVPLHCHGSRVHPQSSSTGDGSTACQVQIHGTQRWQSHRQLPSSARSPSFALLAQGGGHSASSRTDSHRTLTEPFQLLLDAALPPPTLHLQPQLLHRRQQPEILCTGMSCVPFPQPSAGGRKEILNTRYKENRYYTALFR